ncbi:hypothetical protein [Salinivibrio sp. SS2]|uniref:capsular polysaccharide export protein, LipB/KpsS family n=1 Tax=Salinivibrio sp. SS2 TaxID=1892894 RepID=UPI00084C20CA|nr:hypothetical protein [Salinivibrio sp. DV]ODP99286.1 hypothetical protein BGK46_11005 [Salinivibrio sp. DV]
MESVDKGQLYWPLPAAPFKPRFSRNRAGSSPSLFRLALNNISAVQDQEWTPTHQQWLEGVKQHQLSVLGLDHAYADQPKSDPRAYVLMVITAQDVNQDAVDKTAQYARQHNAYVWYVLVDHQLRIQTRVPRRVADILAKARQNHPQFLWQQLNNESRPVHWIANAKCVISARGEPMVESAMYGVPFVALPGVAQTLLEPITHSTTYALGYVKHWSPTQTQQLVLATWLHPETKAYHPETGQSITPFAATAWLAVQVAGRQRTPKNLVTFDVNPYWRPCFRAFFQGSRLRFLRHDAAMSVVARHETQLIWGSRNRLYAERPILRVEDGFIRSVGLGALFAKPISWIVDKRGIYFDATRPSDLEHYLTTHVFTEQERQQGRALKQQLVAQSLTKYNTGKTTWRRPVTDRPIYLVVGQVESDASLQYGSPHVRTNIALLKQVRQQHPDAHIIYKPHPDVIAGARKAGENEQQAQQWCDQIEAHVGIEHLYPHVDAVHVMCSLAGFEALIRGKRVVCHGIPFYAGWGVTDDQYSVARRGVQRTIDELIYAAYIWYPLYIHPYSGYYTTVFDAVKLLAKQKQAGQRFNRKITALVAKTVRQLAGVK